MNNKPSKNYFHLEYAVMCETIGKDMTGKDILVGVTPGGLMAPSFPMKIRCAFWCVLKANNAPKGDHKILLRLQEKDKPEKKLVQFAIEFNIAGKATGTNSFGTPSSEIIIKEPMTAELLWALDGNDFSHFRDIPFVKMPLPLKDTAQKNS